MQRPDHASALPLHVDPIPMPESTEEAELLLLLLEAGLYPKVAPAQSEKIRPDQGMRACIPLCEGPSKRRRGP